MHDFASDIIQLTSSLTLLNSKDDAIPVFIHRMNEIFPHLKFKWSLDKKIKVANSIPVEYHNINYGYIYFNKLSDKEKELFDLLKYTISILAALIEKSTEEELLDHQKDYIQKIIGENNTNVNEVQKELDFYFSNALDLFCIANTDGYFIKLNKEWEATLGYKIEELIGRKFLDFIHPDDLQKTLDAVSDLSSQKKVLNFVNRYKAKDGAYHTIEWRSNPFGKFIYAAARDITDRIRIEQNLKESEEINKLIASLTTDYIMKLDLNESGEISLVYTTDNFESITGRTKAESQDIRNWDRIFHPDDYQKVIQFFNNILSDAKPGELECRSLVRGKGRWINIFAMPVVNEDTGKIISITAAVKDISDRKNTEMQLKFSEEKFLKAFLSTPDAVTIASCSTGKYIDVNEVFLRNTGYLRHEVIDKTAEDLNLWVDTNHREIILDSLFKTGHVVNFETKFRMRSGKIRICLLTGEVIEVNKEKRSLFYIRDITEQKKAEEEIRFSEYKFRSIFENSSIGIALVGLDGKYLMVNQSLCKIMGYNEDELLQFTFYELTHPDDRDMSGNALENTINGKTDEFNFAKRYIHKEGRIIWTEVSSRLLTDEENNPLYFITHVKDITERMYAENLLRENEEKFRIAFDNAPTGMSIISANGFKYLAVNPLVCEMFGYTRDEFLEKSITLVTHPDDVERSNEWIRKKMQNEPCEADFEKRFIHRDGHIVWGLVRSQWIRNEDGSPRMAVTHVLDITKKKNAEEALRKSENMMKSIFRAAPTGIGTVINRNFIEVNAKMCEMVGYDREELIGKSAQMIYPSIEEYNYVGTEKYKQIEEHGTGTVETRWLCKNGSIIDVLLSSTPIDPEDLLKGVTFTALDITKRKMDEISLLRFQFSFEQAPLAIFWMNHDAKFTYANLQACQSLGYSSEELLSLSLWDIDPLFPKDKWYEIWESYQDNRKDGGEYIETLHRRKDNTTFPVEVISKHLWFANEELHVSFVQDITARKEAEQLIQHKNTIIENQNEEYKQLNIALQKAKEHAEESDRLKTAFLQNMSHEIRTPMNAIVGFSDLIIGEIDEKDKIDRYAQIINQRSNDLLSIINDILDIAKIESGQLAVNNEYCNLKDLFSELTIFFKEHQKRIGKENIEFNLFTLCEPDYLEIITDKVKIKQIFINLISNAFKFTNLGKIEGGCKLDEKKNLIFYVTDTGMGIPPEKQDLIFDRFTQLNSNLTNAFGGTGLGLSIVKGLLSLLNGKIWLESEPSRGTTFYFNFLYESAETKQQKPAIEEKKNNEYRFAGKTALVVEDDFYNTMFIKEVLSRVGFIIRHTEYGKEAVRIIENEHIDIVLMDIRLPDIDGYEATRKIKLLKPGMKIIAQTAYAAQLDRNKAFDAGCSDYISKPINRDQLLYLISKQFES